LGARNDWENEVANPNTRSPVSDISFLSIVFNFLEGASYKINLLSGKILLDPPKLYLTETE
jgi:hypothetical protein